MRWAVPTGEAGAAGADARDRFIPDGPAPTGGTSMLRLEHAEGLAANLDPPVSDPTAARPRTGRERDLRTATRID
jgi:hypothetical protein